MGRMYRAVSLTYEEKTFPRNFSARLDLDLDLDSYVAGPLSI